jgi:AcrR family transcriptional regulator
MAMARTRPANRISKLVDAAVVVFCRKGYRRTQMADIAAEMGVSPGSLYNYVESKEALFFFALESGLIDDAFEEPAALPIRFRGEDAALKRFAELTELDEHMPVLTAAVRRARAADPRAELANLTRELYESIYRIRHLITLIETSVADLPELAHLFYNLRNDLIERLTKYMISRVRAGQFRAIPDPHATARLLVEMINWFARVRYFDVTCKITDEQALATVLDFVMHALIPEPVERAAKRAHA